MRIVVSLIMGVGAAALLSAAPAAAQVADVADHTASAEDAHAAEASTRRIRAYLEPSAWVGTSTAGALEVMTRLEPGLRLEPAIGNGIAVSMGMVADLRVSPGRGYESALGSFHLGMAARIGRQFAATEDPPRRWTWDLHLVLEQTFAPNTFDFGEQKAVAVGGRLRSRALWVGLELASVGKRDGGGRDTAVFAGLGLSDRKGAVAAGLMLAGAAVVGIVLVIGFSQFNPH